MNLYGMLATQGEDLLTLYVEYHEANCSCCGGKMDYQISFWGDIPYFTTYRSLLVNLIFGGSGSAQTPKINVDKKAFTIFAITEQGQYTFVHETVKGVSVNGEVPSNYDLYSIRHQSRILGSIMITNDEVSHISLRGETIELRKTEFRILLLNILRMFGSEVKFSTNALNQLTEISKNIGIVNFDPEKTTGQDISKWYFESK